MVGTPIKLSGRGSFDLDGDQLAYVWTLHAPNGSAAELGTKDESRSRGGRDDRMHAQAWNKDLLPRL